MDKIFLTGRFSRYSVVDQANDRFRRVQIDIKLYAFFSPTGSTFSFHFCLGYLSFNRGVTEILDF